MSVRDHYEHTTYRVTGVTPEIDIRIGESCTQLDALLDKHASRCWAYITAWNSGSRKLDAAENQRRQSAMEADVKQAGFVFYRGAGVPDAGGWEPEESILVLDINREDAAKLGRKYEQLAVVVGEQGRAAKLIFINLNK